MKLVLKLVSISIFVSACSSNSVSPPTYRVPTQPAPDKLIIYNTQHSVGFGTCATSRGKIIQNGNTIMVEVFRPASQRCGFKDIYAYIGSKAYYLKDAIDGFVKNANGQYTWGSSSGFLIYDVGRNISYSEASSLKLHESSCQDSNCVTNFPERITGNAQPSSPNSQSNNSSGSGAAPAILGAVAAGAIIYGVGKWIFGGLSSGSSSGGSSYSGSSSSSSSQQESISVRSQEYDNAGRKAEGFWVKCGSKSEQRIYRSAWDNGRDWYKPGFPTPYFIAKGNLTLEEVSRKICN